MPFYFDIDENNHFISIKYDSSTTYQDRVRLLDLLISEGEKFSHNNIFIDVSDAARLTTEEQEHYGELLSKKNHLFKRNKVAIFHPQNNPNPLIPTIAYVTGFNDICEFQHKNDAINWLEGKIK